MQRSWILACALLVVPTVTSAQATPAPPPGTLVLERVESGFVIAPDYKITELDDDVAHLAGAYAGWLTEDTLFIGGAAYSVVNRSDDFKMTYGGLLIGWTMPPERRIQFGVRGLAGIGRATLATDIDLLDVPSRQGHFDEVRFGSRPRDGRSTSFRSRIDDDLFIFEPQLTLVTKLTDQIAVHVGAGYRVTAFADRLRERVNGATGNVGVQFGGW